MAKNVIDKLPDEADMDDIIHALYIRTNISHFTTVLINRI